jgi:hypothetical protein
MSKQSIDGYSLSEVLNVGLNDMEPLTEEELGATYDQMIANGANLIYTRVEYIERALEREAD